MNQVHNGALAAAFFSEIAGVVCSSKPLPRG